MTSHYCGVDGANRATNTLMYQRIFNGMFICFSVPVTIAPEHTEAKRYGIKLRSYSYI